MFTCREEFLTYIHAVAIRSVAHFWTDVEYINSDESRVILGDDIMYIFLFKGDMEKLETYIKKNRRSQYILSAYAESTENITRCLDIIETDNVVMFARGVSAGTLCDRVKLIYTTDEPAKIVSFKHNDIAGDYKVPVVSDNIIVGNPDKKYWHGSVKR